MSAVPAAERPADCPRCQGGGNPVKKVTRRRDGSVSSVTFDLRKVCQACKGTGLASVECRT